MQHSLQQTVDMLKVTLEPFNGIEDIARSLGIPLEATRQDGSRYIFVCMNVRTRINFDFGKRYGVNYTQINAQSQPP